MADLSDQDLDRLWRSPMSADWEHREFARAAIAEDRALNATPVAREERAKRWPFFESPAEFTSRLHKAWTEFGSLLPAVRHVLIEDPPMLVQQPSPVAANLSQDDILELRKAAEMEGLSQEFAELECRALAFMAAQAGVAARVLVPKNPTREMVDAGNFAAPTVETTEWGAQDVWAAMIAAAPKPDRAA